MALAGWGTVGGWKYRTWTDLCCHSRPSKCYKSNGHIEYVWCWMDNWHNTSTGTWHINNYQQLDHWGPANDCIWVWPAFGSISFKDIGSRSRTCWHRLRKGLRTKLHLGPATSSMLYPTSRAIPWHPMTHGFQSWGRALVVSAPCHASILIKEHQPAVRAGWDWPPRCHRSKLPAITIN